MFSSNERRASSKTDLYSGIAKSQMSSVSLLLVVMSGGLEGDGGKNK